MRSDIDHMTDYLKMFAIATAILFGSLFLVHGCSGPAFAAEREYTLDQWADAIRQAERNPNYGILSIPCNSEAQCRKYCKNTVYNTLVKYRADRCKEGESDIDCLARRYAPIGASNDPQNLNKNWKKNVLYFLRSK